MVELASNVRLSTKFTLYTKLLSTWFTPGGTLPHSGNYADWHYICWLGPARHVITTPTAKRASKTRAS